MSILRSCLAAAIFTCAASAAFGCYTGLTVIPIAETVGPDQYAIELQGDGSTDGLDADTYIINTQFGFGDRFEAGIDYDASEDADPRWLLNAKYLIAVTGDQRSAAAIGLTNVGRNLRSSPYLVGMRQLGGARGHFGAIRTEGNTRWMVGLDGCPSERLTLMADYISGDENFYSAGINYQFSPSTGVMAGLQFPNSGGDSVFTIHLVICGPYRL